MRQNARASGRVLERAETSEAIGLNRARSHPTRPCPCGHGAACTVTLFEAAIRAVAYVCGASNYRPFPGDEPGRCLGRAVGRVAPISGQRAVEVPPGASNCSGSEPALSGGATLLTGTWRIVRCRRFHDRRGIALGRHDEDAFAVAPGGPDGGAGAFAHWHIKFDVARLWSSL